MSEQNILRQTASPGTSPTIDGRRAWIRFHNDQRVLVTEHANTAWLGRVRDISSGGIGLTLRRRFTPGTELIVELETKAGCPRALSVRVAHSTQAVNDRWIVGCAFDSPLTEKELRDLLPQ
jgi:hypothetical protein